MGYPRLNDLLVVCGFSKSDHLGIRFCVQNSVNLDRDDFNGYPYIRPFEQKAYYFCDNDEFNDKNLKLGTLRQATETCKMVKTPPICSNQPLKKVLRTGY